MNSTSITRQTTASAASRGKLLLRLPAAAVRSALSITLGVWACASAWPAHAAKLYQVELVVFANEPHAYERKETWPNDIELTLPRPLQLLRDADGIAPGASADMNTFESLPRESLALKNEAAALSRSGHRILLHKAWLQPINGTTSARNVYVEGGNGVEPFHELAGTLRLSRQQFVHVDTNLWLAKFASTPANSARPAAASGSTAAPHSTPATSDAPSWPLPPLPPQQSDSAIDGDNATTAESGGDINTLLKKDVTIERVVLMQQHRRLKQKELNYLDHPLFGALIMVTPYDAGATDDDPADTDAAPPTGSAPVSQ